MCFINIINKILTYIKNFLKQESSVSVILVSAVVLATFLVSLFYKVPFGTSVSDDASVSKISREDFLKGQSLVSELGKLTFSGSGSIIQNNLAPPLNVSFIAVVSDSPSSLTNAVPTREGLFVYKVKKGDTLSEIASNFNVSLRTILWANPFIRRSFIREGQEILILPVTGVLHQIEEGETLESIASLYNINSQEIEKFNPHLQQAIQSPYGRLVIPYAKPLKKSNRGPFLPDLGKYFELPTLGWNWGILHGYNAVDISNRCGTPIYASAEGLIVEAKQGWNLGYGNYLKIEHPNRTFTLYAHLGEFLKEKGEYVAKGEEIALMGNTGQAHGPTGCHLHFEVHGAKNPFAKY